MLVAEMKTNKLSNGPHMAADSVIHCCKSSNNSTNATLLPCAGEPTEEMAKGSVHVPKLSGPGNVAGWGECIRGLG